MYVGAGFHSKLTLIRTLMDCNTIFTFTQQKRPPHSDALTHTLTQNRFSHPGGAKITLA